MDGGCCDVDGCARVVLRKKVKSLDSGRRDYNPPDELTRLRYSFFLLFFFTIYLNALQVSILRYLCLNLASSFLSMALPVRFFPSTDFLH